jgi:hypothetical protein
VFGSATLYGDETSAQLALLLNGHQGFTITQTAGDGSEGVTTLAFLHGGGSATAIVTGLHTTDPAVANALYVGDGLLQLSGSTVTPNALLVGNAAGNGVVQAPWFNIPEGDGTLQMYAPPAGYAEFAVTNETTDGTIYSHLFADNTTAQVVVTAGSTNAVLEAKANGTTGLGIYGSSAFVVTGLPTTDPHVVNALWSNSGVLTLSAG